MKNILLPWSFSAGLLLVGCTGSIADSEAEGADRSAPPPSPASAPGLPGANTDAPDPDLGTPPKPTGPAANLPVAPPAGPESAGPLPLRRLSRLEYNNTVRDLLGDTSRPALTLPQEGLGGSGFSQPGKVSEVEARRYGDAAEQLAANAVKDLPKLMGCNPSTAEATCITSFLSSFAKRAYRRPLGTAETSELQAFYQAARVRYDVGPAINLLLQAMLQSPKFIYHWETTDAPAVKEGALIRLDPYHLASRLSFFLWRSMPDSALFAAADGGRLRTAEDVVLQARRMISDKKAHETIADFTLQWAKVKFDGVGKDRKTYPLWTSALGQAMEQETTAFVQAVMAKDGKLATMLTSPVGYLNAALAKVYAVTSVMGDQLKETPLDPTQRAGLFTLGGFLAAQGAEAGSHPIKRGKVIWESLICGSIPPPPMNVPPPEPVAPNLSTRERFAEHSKNACANACHALFDPPGFAFESYDGIGAWRSTDGGKTVDSTGVLKLPLGGAKPFKGAVDMMQTLAETEDVRRCAVIQWTRYALDRHEGADDGGSIARAYDAFKAGHFDLRELMIALAATKTFLYRMPAPGEVL